MVCYCAGTVLAALAVGLIGWAYLKIKKYFEIPTVPKLEEIWWGKGQRGEEDDAIEPFKINVSDEVVKDFKQRVENALPFQEPIENAGQSYGMNTDILTKIVDFWKTQYDWREREKYLNQYPQFRISVQGLKIHYLHVKPSNTEGLPVLPLLLVHGWPGSVREFYEMIPLLTTSQPDRKFVFEIIAPSLPGFWFSDATNKKGLGPANMAVIFKNLMKKLGFSKYYVQGGDWGSVIVTDMATLYPEYVKGILTNMPLPSQHTKATIKCMLWKFFPSHVLTEEEQRNSNVFKLDSMNSIFTGEESGYFSLQSTKPDTVGIGLRDSPVGLLAYIFEKYITWTNPDFLKLENGEIRNKESLTKVLDIITTYWMSRTIQTSVRIYYEYIKTDQKLKLDCVPIPDVPSGVARYAYDIWCVPEDILAVRYANILYSSFHEYGHFAALEVPNVLAEDIYKFVEAAERYHIYKIK